MVELLGERRVMSLPALEPKSGLLWVLMEGESGLVLEELLEHCSDRLLGVRMGKKSV